MAFPAPAECSLELVRPQPSDFTFSNAIHFVVFVSNGPVAVLVQQVAGLRSDFCACALHKWHITRKVHERNTQRSWVRGRVVIAELKRQENFCLDLRTARRQRYRDNTATLGHREKARQDHVEADSFALMQTTDHITIASARFAYAVQHQRPYHDAVSFATQNFVKKDDLKRWLQELPFFCENQWTVLAVWKIDPEEAVTHQCDYLWLSEGNWAREFRTFWRTTEIFKTPKVAAVEPQPAKNVLADHQTIHVIGVENQKVPPHHFVHLFDIWETDNPLVGTGRLFLARKAAEVPRDMSVAQLPRLLGFDTAEFLEIFAISFALSGSAESDF